MEPLPRGAGFEFVNDIFGGAIPRNFIPAVEKGIQESAARGYLAGYPVVDFRVTLYDGSYHDVDSNELSFKMAGRLAFRKCMEQAKPCTAGADHEGGDRGSRGVCRSADGRPESAPRASAGHGKPRITPRLISAEVPMAEMLTYGSSLTSMTQGQGSFRMEMDHYDVVPQPIADKILANAKRPASEEDEE